MLIENGEVGTYIASANIDGAINLDLNAVKIVESDAGTVPRGVKEADDGATKIEVVGAIESIGPPQTSQTNAKAGEKLGVRKAGIVNLIRKAAASNAVAENQALGAAGSGKVKPLTISLTATAAELAAVIAQAEKAVALDATNDKAVKAELLLKG